MILYKMAPTSYAGAMLFKQTYSTKPVQEPQVSGFFCLKGGER
jgi:hypothetical protein